jgi:hypothetical protein
LFTSSFRNGTDLKPAIEENIVGEYDDALREVRSDPKITEILTRQKGNLLTKIAEMKKLSA